MHGGKFVDGSEHICGKEDHRDMHRDMHMNMHGNVNMDDPSEGCGRGGLVSWVLCEGE